jgi:hypothetical protein
LLFQRKSARKTIVRRAIAATRRMRFKGRELYHETANEACRERC